jgi:hypothetical protein
VRRQVRRRRLPKSRAPKIRWRDKERALSFPGIAFQHLFPLRSPSSIGKPGPRSERARKRLLEIKQRIAAGTFVFAEEFPDYRFIKNVEAPQKRRTCDQVFDEFLLACDSRVAKKDLALVTARGYAKLLAQIWRPEIGPRIFDEIRYSELAKIANAYQWSKKTYNNAISVVRCAFDYGYRDHPRETQPGLRSQLSANDQEGPPPL